jgi:hypothetical protein
MKDINVYLTENEKPVKGTVTKETFDSTEKTWPVKVGNETILKSRFDLIIETEEIPPYWETALKELAPWELEQVGVCIAGNGTTLFHKETLEKLHAKIEDIQNCDVTLEKEGDSPYEGKPSLVSSQTTYFVGTIEIALEKVENYQ